MLWDQFGSMYEGDRQSGEVEAVNLIRERFCQMMLFAPTKQDVAIAPMLCCLYTQTSPEKLFDTADKGPSF